MTWQEIISDLTPGLPILALCVIALLVVILDWFLSPRGSFLVGIVALACLAATAALLLGLLLDLAPAQAARPLTEPLKIFGERLILDSLGLYFTLFFVLAAIACVLVSLRTRSLQRRRVGEYYALLLLATVAMSVVVASRDFIVLYLAIETVSLPCYVLVGFPRHDRLAAEASLKYVLYGAVASGVMLFGISYVYGMTGTTLIAGIYGISAERAPTLLIAVILILAGLGFKMALVPFHSWCPDVYQGAPTPITAYLSVASKGAGIAAWLRIVYPLFGATDLGRPIPAAIQQADPWTIFWVLSALTMFLGNLVAIWQTNVKRLLAYSSIAHAGYMAMAFSLMSREAFEAILLYLVIYLVMNLGAFFTVLFIENATARADLASYRGLVRRSPLLTVVLTIFLLSLLGIPPTAGFLAKFKLFGALIKAATYPAVMLAVIAIINTVISAYYYLKVVKAMVFDQGEDESVISTHPLDGTVLVVLAVAVFALFVFWTPVHDWASAVPLDTFTF